MAVPPRELRAATDRASRLPMKPVSLPPQAVGRPVHSGRTGAARPQTLAVVGGVVRRAFRSLRVVLHLSDDAKRVRKGDKRDKARPA